MTLDEIKDHLEAIAKADALPIEDLGEHAKRSALLGLQEVWGAHDWNFRCVDVNFTLTSSADSYDLPDNFDQMRSIREQGSSTGQALAYYIKDDFDALLPKPSAMSTGTPVAYTVFQDGDDSTWKVSFLPKPSGAMTLPMTYLAKAPSDTSNMPTKFHGGVMAFGAKHLYPYSHLGRKQAYGEAKSELADLKRIDQLNVGRVTEMPDETDQGFKAKYEWVD